MTGRYAEVERPLVQCLLCGAAVADTVLLDEHHAPTVADAAPWPTGPRNTAFLDRIIAVRDAAAAGMCTSVEWTYEPCAREHTPGRICLRREVDHEFNDPHSGHAL